MKVIKKGVSAHNVKSSSKKIKKQDSHAKGKTSDLAQATGIAVVRALVREAVREVWASVKDWINDNFPPGSGGSPIVDWDFQFA